MLQKIYISNKCCSFDKYESSQLLSTLKIIIFFLQQISILEWFLKDHVTLKSIDAENSELITGINYILNYIQLEYNYFKL